MNTVTGKGFHRAFTALSSIVVAVAALWVATDTSTLGIGEQGAAIIAFVLAIANIVVTGLRASFDTEGA